MEKQAGRMQFAGRQDAIPARIQHKLLMIAIIAVLHLFHLEKDLIALQTAKAKRHSQMGVLGITE